MFLRNYLPPILASFLVAPLSLGLAQSPVADISLEDVNTSSALFGQSVSPRDFSGSVSVWYFGHST